jgi:hypothetical protein
MSRSATATDTSLGQVFLECIASYSDTAKAKWMFGDREINIGGLGEAGNYVFSQEHHDTQRDKYICEIKASWQLAIGNIGILKRKGGRGNKS